MQRTTRILAIRHGETHWNVDGRLQGQLDIELNTHGKRQAQLLANAWGSKTYDAVYSSDLQRAYQTAQTLAQKKGMQVRTEQGLRERHFGCYQGQTFEQVQTNSPEDALLWRKRDVDFAPGKTGESLTVFSARVLEAINAIAAQHLEQTIVIVTHGGVLDILYRAATHQSLQSPRTWKLGNTCVSTMLWSPQGLALVSWADTTHLQAPSLGVHGEPADLA